MFVLATPPLGGGVAGSSKSNPDANLIGKT
jgi:hypothetical protein